MMDRLLPLFGNPRIKPLLLVLAICSGYFTYQGAAMAIAAGAVDWIGHFGAVIFSIASSTAIYLLWTAAPVAVAKLQTNRERLLGMCMTLLSTLLIASLSSWLNVAGIAGAAALVIHMNVIVGAFEDALDQRYTSVVVMQNFRPDLNQANTLYLTRREAELKQGAYTGNPGPGTVEVLLGTVAGRFADQDQAVAAELARTAGVAEQARGALEAMRNVVNQAGDPVARMESLAREADKLRALLGQLDARGLLSGLRRGLEAMPREVSLQSVSAKTEAGAKAQRAALKRVHDELTETASALAGELDRLAAQPVPDIPAVTRLNPIEAVLKYPLQNAPYWAGGIAMDATPTVLLFYAMLIMYVRGRRGMFVDAVGNMTINEVKLLQHALETVRDGIISRDAIGRLHDEITGEPLEEKKDKKKGKEDDDDVQPV